MTSHDFEEAAAEAASIVSAATSASGPAKERLAVDAFNAIKRVKGMLPDDASADRHAQVRQLAINLATEVFGIDPDDLAAPDG